MPPSGVGAASYSTNFEREALLFRVIDTGSGIDAEKNIIFQPFMQVYRTERKISNIVCILCKYITKSFDVSC